MKILAIDIGSGTEDILIFDDKIKNMENCVKIVLPSPSQIYAAEVVKVAKSYRDLFIIGDIIGGGVFTNTLLKYIGKKLHVIMTERVAYTIRNDPDEVRKLGIEIVKDKPKDFNGYILNLEEININILKSFLKNFNETFFDINIVAVAVQDHGLSSKQISNRMIRIQKMKELLENNPKPESLSFKEMEIPKNFLRMISAANASKRQLPNADFLVMDTASAAILGCLSDISINEYGCILIINIGNSHTMAAIVEKGNIIALMEHHTEFLNPQKIEDFLIDFVNGKIDNQIIFKDGGHGLFYLKEPPGLSNIDLIVVTGPNRNLLTKTNLSFHFSTPAGDVMMTGTMGLVEACKRKFV